MSLRRLVQLSLIAWLVLVLGVSIPRAVAADREINVAAAADLSSALQEVAAGYEKRTGVVVKLSFGASGALTQQIQNGAPFDVFFSADMDYPRQLIAGGQAEERDIISLRRRAGSCCGFPAIRRSTSSTRAWMCCSIRW